jgi:hypothetical protein
LCYRHVNYGNIYHWIAEKVVWIIQTIFGIVMSSTIVDMIGSDRIEDDGFHPLRINPLKNELTINCQHIIGS